MSKFRKEFPDFAAIERHVRRAHAERAVTIAAWIADAIVGTTRGIRDMFGAPPVVRGPRRLVVRTSAPR